MRNSVLALALVSLPLIIVVVAFLLPTIPYVVLSAIIIILALIFGSFSKWDISGFAEKTADILKAEAALVVFGISLGGLVLSNFKDIANVNLIIGILLSSSGFFVFSMIFGVLQMLIKAETTFKKWVGWAMMVSLLYGLFAILLGWSFVIKPIIDSFLKGS